MFTLVAVASMVAVVTGGAGATSTPTLAPATASHATAAGKASTAAAHRGAVLRAANLSTRAGAVRYLHAIGINPRGVVIQRGLRNYAGVNCPGAGWTCTSTVHPVIQIAGVGGKNTFLCSSARCAVVQVAPAAANPNKASCVRITGLGASCTINQSSASANNVAAVYEDAGKLTGLTQTASYLASITQKATGPTTSNQACVHQVVFVDASTSGKKSSVSVALEAHQSVTITQDSKFGGNSAQDEATPSGGCPTTSDPTTRPLLQAQTLTSTVTASGPVTQNENFANGGANVTLDIEQNQSTETGFKGSATGVNNAIFKQTNTLTAIANSPVSVSQTQSSVNGGIFAKVNQDSRDVSTATATQIETQCEDSSATSVLTSCSTTHHLNEGPSSLTQTQHGPVRKTPGDSAQTGNGSDSFTVTQTSRQDSDTGSTQSNVVEGGFSTSGSGTVTQTTNENGQQTQSIQSGQNVNSSINCTSGSSCTATSPPTLMTNGSFEADPFDFNGTLNLGSSNPLTGWTTSESGLYPWGLPYPNVYNAGPTPYGNQWVIVGNHCDEGISWIEQTINTTVGQAYTLSFALASEEGGSGAQVVVSFPTGSSTTSQTFTAPPRVTNFWDTWATSSMDFTADSASATIRFTSVPVSESEGCDAGIDNVAVTAAQIIG
jgi:hypothetical protein